MLGLRLTLILALLTLGLTGCPSGAQVEDDSPAEENEGTEEEVADETVEADPEPSEETDGSGAEASSFVDLGEGLYRSVGCLFCHGLPLPDGTSDPSPVGPGVPALSHMDHTAGIEVTSDVATVVAWLEADVDQDGMALAGSDPQVVLQGITRLREVIAHGTHRGDFDVTVEGPADMPSWDYALSENDVDAILSFLISVNAQ